MKTTGYEISIAQMLEDQMELSEKFTSRNFGLKLGSDFPEIARELLKSKQVTSKLMGEWAMNKMHDPREILEQMRHTSANIADIVAAHPAIYEGPFSFFYWGIQIGRALEKQQSEVLQAIKEQR